ncbi:MAG: hypothetical protein BWY75_01810 [bacterium ADurb.Bin425]|nr:MAG: hypothetical protein BWY75_01810 [bacterium ADurb.Bin425]
MKDLTKKRSPNDGNDVQLMKAEQVLKEEIAKAQTGSGQNAQKASSLPQSAGAGKN